MNRLESIEKSLKEMFRPDLLRITDESHKHAGHKEAGTGVTHIQIHMVSGSFSGIPQVTRHRMVYEVLQSDMSQGLHSVILKLFSPQEIKALAG